MRGAQVGLVDRPRLDAEARLDLFLERVELLLARDREERAQLRLEPSTPPLIPDVVQPVEQRLGPGDDLFAVKPPWLDVDRSENEPLDVLAERDRKLDVSLAGVQVAATMSAGVSCSVSSRLKRAGSPSTNSRQTRYPSV